MKKYSRRETEREVKKILSEKLGTALEEITLDADISKDLGADSLDFAEIILELKEIFDLELPLVDAEDREPEELCTVGRLVDFICEAKAAA